MEDIVPFVEYKIENRGSRWVLIRNSHVGEQVLDTFLTKPAAEAAKRKLEKKR